ncbi:AraC-like DNA-binding protein [Dysgonomonas hofstadii]|uniref:AraC-like DNA-binding protein n=1 Tax=Dysgonomonas hofstadii TaxID=637886 RepID=A0A840CP01_9BACT|nr:helix-turn-helix transcriptional regulator [Dysgonomonas hofstadii]MBB4034705.1 AraC-like DNA-binding protein [Dysgonomonas hofstadii]
MNKIPIHKISEKFDGAIAKLKHMSKDGHNLNIDYAHRDDYYIFFFIEKGNAKLLIDFKEYELRENTVYYILPGQVHLLVDHSIDTSAWVLIVDRSHVKDKYKEIFERSSLSKSQIEPNESTIDDLQDCISILERRFSVENQSVSLGVLHDLLSSYIGIIAEVYQKGLPIQANKRTTIITFQFKTLLSANYQSLKSPSQYAAKLNISPIYLNEAVKTTTGLTVRECIRNEIIVRAKRLLFHTTMSVKEIALELGYEDWAYFTRMFSKASLLSPTQFRAKYLK